MVRSSGDVGGYPTNVNCPAAGDVFTSVFDSFCIVFSQVYVATCTASLLGSSRQLQSGSVQ